MRRATAAPAPPRRSRPAATSRSAAPSRRWSWPAFVSAKFLVFGDEPRAEAEGGADRHHPGRGRATPSRPRWRWTAARRRHPRPGAADPVVAAAGRAQVAVTRAGAPPCEQSVELGSRKVEVVRVLLPEGADHGRLILVGVDPQAPGLRRRSGDLGRGGARAAPPGAGGGAHRSRSSPAGGAPAVVEEFTVELEPGQEERASSRPRGPRQARDRAARASRGADERRRDASRATTPISSPDSDADTRARNPARAPASPPGSAEPPRPARAQQQGSAARPAAQPLRPSPAAFTAYTQPFARVFIDGKDTGKMTPIAPRSAITLVARRATRSPSWSATRSSATAITIAPGETQNLVKTLPVE